MAAGDGIDTLNISISGTSTGTPSIQAFQATGLEKILISNFDSVAPAVNHTVDLTLVSGVTTVGLTSSSANGDTVISGLNTSIVAAEMKNGAADLTLTYGASVVAGTTDTQTLTVSNTTGGTFTANGAETIAVTSELVASTLAGVASDKITKLTIAGDKDLTITAGTTFAVVTSTATIASEIDASTATGNVNVTVSDTSTAKVTTGTGNDTINMGGTLDTNDVINGGTGTNKLTMTAATLATQFTNVSNVQTVAYNNAAAAVAMDVSKLSTGVTTIELDVNDGTDAGSVLANTVTNLNGQTVNLKHSESDLADTGGDNDGVTYTITNATDTATDTINITLDGIGTDTQATDASFGIDTIDIGNFETINIASNTNSAISYETDGTTTEKAIGAVTANTIDTLTAGSATGIVLTGATALTLTDIAGGTATTSIDASAMTGAFTGTLSVASDVAVKLATVNSTINMAGTLNASDTITGGAGTADVVTATGVTGLTATTGALNITGVETVTLTTTGNNTLNLAGVTGANTVSVSANTQTVTGFDLANTTLSMTGAALINVTGADATGTADTLKIKQDVQGDVSNTVTVGTAVETLSITLDDTGATVNNATFVLTNAAVGSIVVTEDAATTTTGTTVALGTLNASVNSVDTSGVKGTQAFSVASATAATTLTLAGTAVATVTGSAFADTFNVGSTAGVTHVLAGGAGEDILNITAATGLVNVGSISAVENINIAVVAGNDITLTTSFHADVDNVVVTGGNSLSTLTTGTLVDTIQSVDASAFTGNIVAAVIADKLDTTVEIKGGALLTDTVTNQITAAATSYALKSTGVEILTLNVDADATVSLANATGLTTVNVDVATTKTAIISGVTNQTIVVTDAATNTGTINAVLANATGASDVVNFKLLATAGGAGAIADTTMLKTDDVETVNIEAKTTAETISLANLAMTTAAAVMTLNVTGDAALTISALNADVTTVNASANTAGFIMTGRSATGISTITGSTEADTIIMMNSGDILNATSNTSATATDTDLLDINFAAVLGGLEVNLANTGDQVTTFNGAANAAVQSNFTSVDASGYTGSFGAQLTANALGSTMTGTANADVINGGTGADTISGDAGSDSITISGANNTVTLNQVAGLDTITGFATGDTLANAAGNEIGTATSGTEVTKTAAFATAALATDTTNILTFNASTTSALATTGTATITDFTDVAFGGDVMTYLDEVYSVTAIATEAVVILNDGTDSFVYYFLNDSDTTFDAGDTLTLVGQVTDHVIVAADVAVL